MILKDFDMLKAGFESASSESASWLNILIQGHKLNVFSK